MRFENRIFNDRLNPNDCHCSASEEGCGDFSPGCLVLAWPFWRYYPGNIHGPRCAPRPFLLPHLVESQHDRIMDYCYEMASTFFTLLAYGFTRMQCPAVVPPPKFLGSPAPQTSLSTSSGADSFDDVLICLASFRSFRAPKRAHPFHSLLHLARPAAHWSPCAIPRSIQYGDQRSP